MMRNVKDNINIIFVLNVSSNILIFTLGKYLQMFMGKNKEIN